MRRHRTPKFEQLSRSPPNSAILVTSGFSAIQHSGYKKNLGEISRHGPSERTLNFKNSPISGTYPGSRWYPSVLRREQVLIGAAAGYGQAIDHCLPQRTGAPLPQVITAVSVKGIIYPTSLRTVWRPPNRMSPYGAHHTADDRAGGAGDEEARCRAKRCEQCLARKGPNRKTRRFGSG
jgi:hypothetical protein